MDSDSEDEHNASFTFHSAVLDKAKKAKELLEKNHSSQYIYIII